MDKKLLSILFLFSLLFLLFITSPLYAADTKVEFEGRYWAAELSAKAKVTEDSTGTSVDFKDDLGISDESFPEGRFTWYINPRHRIRLAYTHIDYSGDKYVEKTIEFAGKTYTAGTRVVSDLDAQSLSFGWHWQFISISHGSVKLGTVVGAKGFWIDASLKAPDIVPPIKESERFTAGFPVVGVVLDINPHKVINIAVEASGISAGKYGYAYDAEAVIKIIPLKNLSILGGYRAFSIKAKDDPDYAHLKISGPFAGAALRF